MAKTQEYNRDTVLEKLRSYFQLWLTINRACLQYNDKHKWIDRIARSTIQWWYEEDEDCRQKIDAWKDTPNVIARNNWIKELKNWTYQASKDWLERREKNEFSLKQEQEINQTNLNFSKEDLSNMTNEEFKSYRDKYLS